MIFKLIKEMKKNIEQYKVSPTGVIEDFRDLLIIIEKEFPVVYKEIEKGTNALTNWQLAYRDEALRDQALEHGEEVLIETLKELIKYQYRETWQSVFEYLGPIVNKDDLKIIEISVDNASEHIQKALASPAYSERLEIVLNNIFLDNPDGTDAKVYLNKVNRNVTVVDQIIDNNVNNIEVLIEGLRGLIELTSETLIELDINVFSNSYSFEYNKATTSVSDMAGDMFKDKVIDFLSNYKESIEKTMVAIEKFDSFREGYTKIEEAEVVTSLKGIIECFNDNQLEKVFIYSEKLNNVDELIHKNRDVITEQIDVLRNNVTLLDKITDKALPNIG